MQLLVCVFQCVFFMCLQGQILGTSAVCGLSLAGLAQTGLAVVGHETSVRLQSSSDPDTPPQAPH